MARGRRTVPIGIGRVLRGVEHHLKQLEERHDQRAEGDGPEGQRGRAPKRTQRRMFGLEARSFSNSIGVERTRMNVCTISPSPRGPK
jgi:hypothetical protein